MTTNTHKKEDNQLITIEGLKGVGNVELNLMPNQRVYTFIGSNGVGKTKVLEALFQGEFFINKTVHASYISEVNTDTGNLSVSKKITYQNLYSVNFDKKNHFGTLFNPHNNFILHEPVGLELKTGACVFLGAKQRSDIDNKELKSLPQLGIFSERRKNYFEYIINKMKNDFHSLGMSEDIKLWFVLRYMSSVLTKSDNRRFEIDNVLKILNKIDEKYDAEFIDVDGDFNLFLKNSGNKITLNHLSSGFASLLRIIQGIISGYANFTNETNLTDVPGIVFIDEIESHLHLEWQVKIIPLLKDIFPNTTFYIATHSPLVLTQLQQGEAYKLVRGDDGVVRSELIKNPSKKLFDDVLDDAFSINLNHLKIQAIKNNIKNNIKNVPKKKLLDFLNEIEQEDKNNNIDAKDLIE